MYPILNDGNFKKHRFKKVSTKSTPTSTLIFLLTFKKVCNPFTYSYYENTK